MFKVRDIFAGLARRNKSPVVQSSEPVSSGEAVFLEGYSNGHKEWAELKKNFPQTYKACQQIVSFWSGEVGASVNSFTGLCIYTLHTPRDWVGSGDANDLKIRVEAGKIIKEGKVKTDAEAAASVLGWAKGRALIDVVDGEMELDGLVPKKIVKSDFVHPRIEPTPTTPEGNGTAAPLALVGLSRS